MFTTVHEYIEPHENIRYTEPITNDLLDEEVAAFVGPVAVYIVHSPLPSFSPYSASFRCPLSRGDVEDIREWTEADVSGPFASNDLGMLAIGARVEVHFTR